jgi:hypothetical protein
MSSLIIESLVKQYREPGVIGLILGEGPVEIKCPECVFKFKGAWVKVGGQDSPFIIPPLVP